MEKEIRFGMWLVKNSPITNRMITEEEMMVYFHLFEIQERDEKIDVTCHDSNGRVVLSLKEMEFHERYYKPIEQGVNCAFVGVHFTAEQMADMQHEILRQLYNYMYEGRLDKLYQRLSWAVEKLATRRQQKWYTSIVKHFKSKNA